MAAALLLARDGHRVMVFERFDEPRPLGSGLMLQPTGLAVLDQLGLATAAIAAGQRIDRLCGKAGNRTVLDVRYSSMRGRLFGVGIHRSALFSLLHDALKSDGAAIATGREVTGVERRSDGIRLLFALGSAEGPFDLAVDALGTRSALSPDVGRELRYGALWTNVNLPRDEFDRHMLSQRYRRASVMAGVLPIGGEQAGFFWSLRAKDHATWLATGLESWKSDVRSLWPATSPLLDQIGSHDELTFARYAHKTIHRPAGDRLIHIGDSWHSASPQLGQGANMALLDAFRARESASGGRQRRRRPCGSGEHAPLARSPLPAADRASDAGLSIRQPHHPARTRLADGPRLENLADDELPGGAGVRTRGLAAAPARNRFCTAGNGKLRRGPNAARRPAT
jgi:2-polyprenyl-6-methoxyphenol hydroxylase-like FAD-dependent oxidoreductase